MKCTKLVYGVGVNDYEGLVKIDGRNIKSYDTWRSLLRRCYSLEWHDRFPTYIGCSVCDEWKYFSKFKEYFDSNYIEDYELDKDILTEGNKIYSPDNCRFIPKHLNYILNSQESQRGEFPVGVSALKPNKGNGRVNMSYQGSCRDHKGKQLSKTFKTIEEATNWRRSIKKKIVIDVAIESFLDNEILSDIATALIEREF